MMSCPVSFLIEEALYSGIQMNYHLFQNPDENLIDKKSRLEHMAAPYPVTVAKDCQKLMNLPVCLLEALYLCFPVAFKF